MKCKNILQMLSFFVFFVGISLQGQSFKSVDFERMINNHPMMKNFDPSTGRFKNTGGEVKSPDWLKKEINRIKNKLNNAENSRQILLKSSFSNNKDEKIDEGNLWQNLNKLSAETIEAKSKLTELEELLAMDGIPPISRNLPIARRIILETKAAFKKGDNDIVLNKLPRFFELPPTFTENPLKIVFANPEKSSELVKYLENLNTISLLFRGIAEPVLFEKRNSTK